MKKEQFKTAIKNAISNNAAWVMPEIINTVEKDTNLSTEGDKALYAGGVNNALLWDNLDSDFVDACIELETSGDMVYSPCSMIGYLSHSSLPKIKTWFDGCGKPYPKKGFKTPTLVPCDYWQAGAF